MSITIESTDTVFGEAHVITATKDKFHRSIVREFFSYTDAQVFAASLLKRPLDADMLAMFKRKVS